MDTPSLEIKNLTKKYENGPIAVDNISLSLKSGEFFGFLGPNGAGKTSTIKCITGVARITSGTIKVSGIDVVEDYRQARRRVGIAPQEFNVDIFSTVAEILDYVAGYYGFFKKTRIKRVDELLAQFDLEQYRDTQFQHLSGGFKRRVMLARALVHDPDLLILDEPTAGVDVELRHDLWRYLKNLNAEGKTILLTSHYLEEVERLCSRIALIHKAKIVAEGSKKEFMKGSRSLEERYLEITREGNKES
ncbi:MAG: ABC transporter ATP-binding protein [Candidatus Paceibacterota bacterium]